ncbi:MAG: hypothetical protein HY788_20930 [Deltaproteobacteria bacterium]|nr:hypothetical protein [Deltaproteobacteria bacterium]
MRTRRAPNSFLRENAGACRAASAAITCFGGACVSVGSSYMKSGKAEMGFQGRPSYDMNKWKSADLELQVETGHGETICEEIDGRRVLKDRRRKPTNPFGPWAFKGRRRTVRRLEDRRRTPCVDQYDLRLFLVSILIVLLCTADGLYTILHVSNGAVEVNPFMDSLLRMGPEYFFYMKYMLTALCVFLLVLYRYHPVARIMMMGVVTLYGLLLSYHILLLVC